ncbi:DNA damage-binding protein 2-like [Babylonia areolata]|uniref:DNA damage-binding protein 2-like n=1 Tax=Babylonia areolata TaxID=304850 RepID=UPI003FD1FD1E
MPSSSSSQKRNSRSVRTTKEIPNITSDSQSHTHPSAMKSQSLASKLKKRMLEESGKDVAEGKRTRTDDSSERDCEHGTEDCGRNILCNFEARQSAPCVYSTHGFQRLLQSHNLTHYLYGASLGFVSATNRKSVLSPVVRELQDLRLFRTASPFDRRVTALEWHPTAPNMVVVGSKGGDLICWNTLHQNLNDHFIQGIGPGGSIQAVKIWPWNSDWVLTASIDGRVMIRDWEQKHCQILSDTLNCYDFWYCCVDVSGPRKVVVTGDNVGKTTLLSLEGKKLWTHRLHKQKVTHAEFSPREDWLFCTASVDHTVKVWDLRSVSGPSSALHVLEHDKPVNSAYFSRTDGCRLLTTDQYSQIRVYCTSGWHLERTVEHPHRFFQHITPIKASWHPLQDVIVVGRYPCKDFPGYTENERRTIDMIDADTGKMMCQLFDPSSPGIVSLTKFNDRGDYLVSGMGVNLLLWGRSQEVEERQQSLLARYQLSDLDPRRSGRRGTGGQSTSHRRSSSSAKKSKDTDVKVKVVKKTKTDTKKR